MTDIRYIITTAAGVDDVWVGEEHDYTVLQDLVSAIQRNPNLAITTDSGRIVFGRHVISLGRG